MPTETRHNTVRSALVLDLHHGSLVRLVSPGQPLRNDTVEPGTFESYEPIMGARTICCRGRDVHRTARTNRDVGKHPFEDGAALRERTIAEIVVTESKDVEHDDLSRSCISQHAHTRIGWMNALAKRVEVEHAVHFNNDLAIEHATRRQTGKQRGNQLGEVTREGLLVPTAEYHLVAVTEHDRTESVPFRIEQPTVAFRQARRRLCQHRRNRRHHRKLHGSDQPRSSSRTDRGHMPNAMMWNI